MPNVELSQAKHMVASVAKGDPDAFVVVVLSVKRPPAHLLPENDA